ncbi:heme peroxidase, partial [Chytriomyces sp. MP71]
GPAIKWRPGRVDAQTLSEVGAGFGAPNSASESPADLQAFFSHFNLQDRQVVALMGAHQLGFCHLNKTGFNGPWSLRPYNFGTEYFDRLVNHSLYNTYTRQDVMSLDPHFGDRTRYVDTSGTGNGLIMLPADISLTRDPGLLSHITSFSQNPQQFPEYFQTAFQSLLEFGLNLQSD